MRWTHRTRKTVVVTALAAVIAGGSAVITVGTVKVLEPDRPAATLQSAKSGQAAQSGYADAIRKVLPSVVLIRSENGLGSGVVLNRNGDIVTTAHVAGNPTIFDVQLAGDPQPRQARLMGAYPEGDLAVIRVQDPSGLRPASFGDSDEVHPGDVVLAVGNPLGLSSSATAGIVSATGRTVSEPASAGSPRTTLPNVIQTSAPINPGNSGGALVDTSGQVIGIPTLVAASPHSDAQGIGFAVPSNTARDLAVQLIMTGRVTKAHQAAIGAEAATVINADDSPAGAGIISIIAGGPAEQAGLRAGDVITSFGGRPTPDTNALAQALAVKRPRDVVPVTAERVGQQLTVDVTLGELSGG
jgi:putative serine protease PepD